MYMPDANVWIGFGRDQAIEARLRALGEDGQTFAVAPPALIELFTGLGRDENNFRNDQRIFAWMQQKQHTILELPKPFMARALNTTLPNASQVKPEHYRDLIQMVVDSSNQREFVSKANAASSVWRMIESIHEIHNGVLDEELVALRRIPKEAVTQFLAEKMCDWFGAPGFRPNPVVFRQKFAAALEFLDDSLAKVRHGAKPEKNDRGLFVDFRLLFYLADPQIHFLTCEDFSTKVKTCPQATRILTLASLLR
jgi:hypothetical protein